MTNYTKIQAQDEKEMAQEEAQTQARVRTDKLIDGVLRCANSEQNKEGKQRACDLLRSFHHCLFLSHGDDMWLYDVRHFRKRFVQLEAEIDRGNYE